MKDGRLDALSDAQIRGIDIMRAVYTEPQKTRELCERGTVSNIIKVAGKYVDMSIFDEAEINDLWIASDR